MGHLYQTGNHKISTQPTSDTIAEKKCEPATPVSLHFDNIDTTHIIFATILKTGRIYTDQTC